VIKAVVFDLDGTLFDHDGAALTGLRAWLPTLGRTALSTAEAEALWFALEARHYQRYVDRQVSHRQQRRDRTRDFLLGLGVSLSPTDPGSTDLTASLDQVFDGYLAAYTTAWRAYDDAAATLVRARAAGLSTAVLTNGDETQQRAKLRATGLLELAGPVFASSALPAAKPSPQAYDAVARQLGHDPAELLMVGDNPDADVAGATAAGWHAVHLDRSERPVSGSIASLTELAW